MDPQLRPSAFWRRHRQHLCQMLSADLRGSDGLHCCRARQQRVGSQPYSPTIHTTTSERQHSQPTRCSRVWSCNLLLGFAAVTPGCCCPTAELQNSAIWAHDKEHTQLLRCTRNHRNQPPHHESTAVAIRWQLLRAVGPPSCSLGSGSASRVFVLH